MPEKKEPIIDLEKRIGKNLSPFGESEEDIGERVDRIANDVEDLKESMGSQVDAKGRQLINVSDPSRDEDGVNKRYVDGNGARAYRVTSVQAITTDTWTKVQLNAETFDIDKEMDVATNYRFTAKKKGYYLVSGALKYQNVAASLPFHIAFYKNGAVYSQIRTFAVLAGDDEGIGLSDTIYLDIGDYVELYTYHYMGGPTKNIMNGTDITFLSIYKLT